MQQMEASGPAAASMLLGAVSATVGLVGFVTDQALELVVSAVVADVGGLVAGLSAGWVLYRKAAKWHHEDRAYLAEANRDLREQLSENRKTLFELEEKFLELMAEVGEADE